jgi:DNA-binding XRE family transcriptional regulator
MINIESTQEQLVNKIKEQLQKDNITKTTLAKELEISVQNLVNYLNLHSNTPHIEYKLEKWLLSHLK